MFWGRKDLYLGRCRKTYPEKGVPLEIRDEKELIGNLGAEGDYWFETVKEIMKIYGK